MSWQIREPGDADWLKRQNDPPGKEHPSLLEFKRYGATTLARVLVDDLSHPTAPGKLRQEFEAHFASAPPGGMVLDFLSVKRVASAAIGTVVWLNDAVKKRGGRLALSGIHSNVLVLFDLCGIGKQVPVFPAAKEALLSLQPKGR